MTSEPGPPITVFILSYNRPLYLWVCLDSLYRHTKHPARFILADNNSTDPLVDEVIQGFERRDLFEKVYRCPENSPGRLQWLVDQHKDDLGEFFAFVESDVYIYDSEKGWLQTMLDQMRERPDLYLLGSLVDKLDFIDYDAAKQRFPDIPEDQLEFLVRIQNPERQPYDTQESLIEPHNPPGRLLLFRTAMLDHAPIQTDAKMYARLKEIGLSCKISTRVVHRHLSMLNIYDYWDYDRKPRQGFFQAMDDHGAQVVTSAHGPGFSDRLPSDPIALQLRNEYLRSGGASDLRGFEAFLFGFTSDTRFPRYVESVLQARPDVQAAFGDREISEVLRWMSSDGVEQMKLRPELVALAAQASGVDLSQPRLHPRNLLRSLKGRLNKR